MTPLDRAIKAAGSPSELARRLDVFPQTITNWGKRGVPPTWCIPIEAAVEGVVTRYELRPDVFGKNPSKQAA